MRRLRLVLCVLTLAVGLPRLLLAQGSGGVRGTVTSTTGEPLSGAVVTVRGGSLRGITDSAGRYSIGGVPTGSQTVDVRRLGFGFESRAVNVAAGETAQADFRLSPAPEVLSGIVTVGYGSQERQTVTGSISSVTPAEIKDVPTSDVIHAIQGRVPGVEIVASSNIPGASMNIRIRGLRSLTASNNPLFVLDGIPMAGGIEDLDPANIASIDVLKDAASTAIYGSRGANGVVLITSKSGSDQGLTTHFTLNGYYGGAQPLKLVDMMNQQQFVAYLHDAAARNGIDTSLTTILNPTQLAAYKAGQQTDWQRAVLASGQQENYQLGVTGASGTTRYALSGNFFNQQGITIGQSFNRGTGSASVQHQFERLDVGATANFTHSIQNVGGGNGVWGTALAETPFGTPYDSNHILVPRPDADPLIINPVASALNTISQNTRNRLFASAFSQVKLLPWLNWRMNFGADITGAASGTFYGPVTQTQQLAPPAGTYANNTQGSYTLDNLLQASRDIGSKQHVDVTLLYSIQNNKFTSENISSISLPYTAQLWYNLGSGTIQSVGSSLSTSALQSYMARAVYTLMGRYTISASSRRDGSSVLAEGNKWASFPSLGAAWQLGDEQFMHRFNFLTGLKLRADYGSTGNAAISPYQTEGTLNRTVYNFNTSTGFGYAPGSIPNPNLKWEKTAETDVGMDFGILDNRVSGTVDWYRSNTTDLLMQRALPATSGFSSTLQNIGATMNRGLEIGITTENLTSWHGIDWSTTWNWAHDHGAIVSLANGVTQDVGNVWFVGQPINIATDAAHRVFYDYKFLGIWQTADSALAASFGRKPGQIRVADLNGDGKITAADREIVGNTYPRWTGSIYNRVAWKGWDVSALATATIGYTMYDDFDVNSNNLQGRYNNIVTNYWTPTNPSTTEPAPGWNGVEDTYITSKAYKSGSHWRIRNVTVGYTVTSASLRHYIDASQVRFYFTAQDPYVFTHYKGYDPENGTYGGVPSYRTLLIGANVAW